VVRRGTASATQTLTGGPPPALSGAPDLSCPLKALALRLSRAPLSNHPNEPLGTDGARSAKGSPESEGHGRVRPQTQETPWSIPCSRIRIQSPAWGPPRGSCSGREDGPSADHPDGPHHVDLLGRIKETLDGRNARPPQPWLLGQELLDSRDDHFECDPVLSSFGHDDIGPALGRLDKLLVHGPNRGHILAQNILETSTPFVHVPA